MSDFDVFEATGFALQKGGALPVARLAYKTLGTLSPAGDNVVLIPSWYSGTHREAEFCMVGPDRAITPDKHFIVFVNLLSGGVPPPQQHAGTVRGHAFPARDAATTMSGCSTCC